MHFLGVLLKTQVSGLRLQHKGEMGYKDFLHLLLIFFAIFEDFSKFCSKFGVLNFENCRVLRTFFRSDLLRAHYLTHLLNDTMPK